MLEHESDRVEELLVATDEPRCRCREDEAPGVRSGGNVGSELQQQGGAVEVLQAMAAEVEDAASTSAPSSR